MRGIYSLRLRVDWIEGEREKEIYCLSVRSWRYGRIHFISSNSFLWVFFYSGFFSWFFWFYFRLSSLKGFYGCITFYLRRTFDVLLPFLSFISASTSYVGVQTSFLLSYLLVHPLDSLFYFSFFELAS